MAALRGAWWEIYNDTQLNRLEEQVGITNQNVVAAEARFREAKAVVSGARAAQLPSVDGIAGCYGFRNECRIETFSTAPLKYPSTPSGRLMSGEVFVAAVAANAALAQASAAELENAQLLYQSQLAVDYFQIQGLDAEQQLAGLGSEILRAVRPADEGSI
jgi:outer membrane protein TolC